jgi:hypothetical protein
MGIFRYAHLGVFVESASDISTFGRTHEGAKGAAQIRDKGSPNPDQSLDLLFHILLISLLPVSVGDAWACSLNWT